MKRKRNNEYEPVKKRKKTSIGYTLSHENKAKDRSIYDYWSSDKANPKNKVMTNQNVNILNPLSSKFNLVKNPSKQHLVSGSMNLKVNDCNFNNDYKKTILIDEDLIENLNRLLCPFLTEISNVIKKSFHNLNHVSNQNIMKVIDKYMERNSLSLCAKFILQQSKNFLFIPRSFTTKSYNKNMLPFLESFNDTRHIKLQYHPFNSHEILNSEFSSSLLRYLKDFSRKIKQGQLQKAIVLYDPSEKYIDRIKEIESICNSIDFKIIRIDELETHKNKQLQKISEATKSQRLSSLPDSISERLRMIERIVNNDHKRLNAFVNKTSLSSESDSFSLSTNAGDTITHYFSKDTKERSIYNIIEDNVFQICAKKKTLILIVDTFTNSDCNKTYLNNIVSKASDTKCPIAILTNNLNFAKADSFFSNSSKTVTNIFSYYHIDDLNWKFYVKALCSLSIILFLHLYVEDTLKEFINIEDNGDTGNRITRKLQELLDETFLTECINSDVFYKIVNYSEYLLKVYNCDMNEIMYHLKDKLRFFSLKENKERNSLGLSLTSLIELIKANEKDYYESFINEDDIDLKNLVKRTESNSFDDYCTTRITSIGDKNYRKFYDDFSYTMKKSDKVTLIPEDLVNCECSLLYNYLKVNDNHSYSLVTKYHKDINMILREDVSFLRNFIVNKIPSITLRNCYEYNFLFSSINKLSDEDFANFLQIKNPRSTSKLYTQRDKTYQCNHNRIGAIARIFRGANIKLIERYLTSHSLNAYRPKRYYSDYKTYEELKNHQETKSSFVKDDIDIDDSCYTDDNKELY